MNYNLKLFINITLVTIAFTALTSCELLSSNNPKGTVITAEQFSKLNENATNKNKRLSIVGYPYITGDVNTSRGNKSTQISIFSQPRAAGNFIGSVPVQVSLWGSNRVDVPKTFTSDQIVFYTNDGKKHATTEKLQFSFTVDLQIERGKKLFGKDSIYFGELKNVRLDKAK